MNTKHNFSTYARFVSLVALSLITVGCSASTKPAPTPVVVKPTQIPTKPQPTIAPTHPKPTATPIVVPTVMPTTQPAGNSIPFGKVQTISDISINPSAYELLTESGSDKPTTGDQYLVVTFSIENMSKTANFSFDPLNMVILDPTGTQRTMVSLKSLTNELKTQTLLPGAKLDGVIAFEIPQQENKWTLEFKGTNNQNLMWPNPNAG